MNAAASHGPGPQHQTLSQCPQLGGKLPRPKVSEAGPQGRTEGGGSVVLRVRLLAGCGRHSQLTP